MNQLNIIVRKLAMKNPKLISIFLRIIRQSGFDISYGINQAAAILLNYGINLILDVGANTGQYGLRARALGYQGRIVSFEPVFASYTELTKSIQNDPLWTSVNIGCGDYDGKATINTFNLSVMNSILPPSPLIRREYPQVEDVGQEDILISKIDTIFSQYYTQTDTVLLKIDTQGFEKNVLEGANISLDNILGIQLELSFVEHYRDETLFVNMVDFLSHKGFTLVCLEPLTHNLENGKFLQADGTFFRLDRISSGL
jgi:FkbM family methyltransferase